MKDRAVKLLALARKHRKAVVPAVAALLAAVATLVPGMPVDKLPALVRIAPGV